MPSHTSVSTRGTVSTSKESVHVFRENGHVVLTITSSRGSIKAAVMMTNAEAERVASLLTGRR